MPDVMGGEARRRDLEENSEEPNLVDISTIAMNLMYDLRYGLRQLKKSPGFAVTALTALALGLGAHGYRLVTPHPSNQSLR